MGFVARHLALSVRKRVFGGFAVVLLLLAVLAAVGLRGMQQVGDGAGGSASDSALAASATEVGLRVNEARAAVVQYALTATMDDQKAAQASLASLDQAIEHGSGQSGDLRGLITTYRASVDAAIAAVDLRRAGIEQMLTAATEMRTIVSAVTRALDREDEPVALRSAARVADSFGAADSAAARFIALTHAGGGECRGKLVAAAAFRDRGTRRRCSGKPSNPEFRQGDGRAIRPFRPGVATRCGSGRTAVGDDRGARCRGCRRVEGRLLCNRRAAETSQKGAITVDVGRHQVGTTVEHA